MLEFIQSLLLAVVTAAVPVLATYAGSALKRIAEKKAVETENVKVAGYLREIGDAVSDAVAATSQTYVDALKKAGKFDFIASKEAANMAFAACWKAVSPAAKEFLTAAYEDVEAYLKGKIEAEVKAQKGGNVLVLGETV